VANDRIVPTDANIRIDQEQFNDCLHSPVDTLRTLRRMGSDVVEDGTEIGERRKGSGVSQSVFGPNCANLPVCREFAARCGRF
jgi:hypothetical protein